MATAVTNPWPDLNLSGPLNVARIVRTYELPKALRERIEAVASRRCGEGAMDSFAEQYACVAELVERFTAPYPERFALRLDRPLFDDGRRAVHEVVGTDDPDLTQLIEGKHPIKALHAREIVDILQAHLSRPHLDFIRGLLQNRAEESLWQFSAERIGRKAPEIAATMKRLEARYGRGGRILMPPRPIKSVTRRPSGELAIRYGDRRYHGDPLAFFEHHHEIYGGMTRSDLYRFDQGLYQTLRSAGQLGQAIPEKAFDSGRPCPQTKIEKIVKTYRRSGNLAKTARLNGCCVPTVRKYVQSRDLEIKKGRKP